MYSILCESELTGLGRNPRWRLVVTRHDETIFRILFGILVVIGILFIIGKL